MAMSYLFNVLILLVVMYAKSHMKAEKICKEW